MNGTITQAILYSIESGAIAHVDIATEFGGSVEAAVAALLDGDGYEGHRDCAEHVEAWGTTMEGGEDWHLQLNTGPAVNEIAEDKALAPLGCD